MENELKVGQILYRERHHKKEPSEIEGVEIAKIGKKYFYLKGDGYITKYGFDKNTLLYSDKIYSQCDIQLYRTKTEILEKNEKQELLSVLRKHFDFWGKDKESTLDQLRQVAEILGINNKNEN